MKRIAVVVLLLLPLVARAGDDPLTEIGRLLNERKGEEAHAKARAAIETYKRAKDEGHEALSYLMLAFTDAARNDIKSMRADFAEAATRLQAAGDLYAAWFALITLGELDRQQGQVDEAIHHHEQALQVLDKLSAPGANLSLDTLRLIAPITGSSLDAFGPLAQNPTILKPFLMQMAEVATRDAYAGALLEINELDKAERELTRAAELARMFGGMLDPTIDTHLGDLRRQQWRLDEARELYRKALAAPSFAVAGVSSRNDLHILGQLADLELLAGRTDAALAWNDKSLDLARQAKDTKREARILEDRGEVLRNSGRYDDAENVFDQALKLAESSGYIYEQASIKSAVGIMNMVRGRYGTSIADLEKSIELLQKVDEPYVEASVWALLADVYILLDKHDTARMALGKAGELAKKSHFRLAESWVKMLETNGEKLLSGKDPRPELAKALADFANDPEMRAMSGSAELRSIVQSMAVASPNAGAIAGAKNATTPFVSAMLDFQRGRALMQQGDIKGARELWIRSLNAQPNRDLRAMLLALVGATYWREGDQAKGMPYMLQCADAFEQQIDDIKFDELLSSYLGGFEHHFFFDFIIDFLLQQNRIAEAFDRSERARARAFLQLVGNHKLGSGRGSDAPLAREAESLRIQLAKWERESSLAPSPQLANDLKQGRARYETLLQRVKVTNPEYESLIRVEPLRLGEVQKELAPDVTLVSYYVLPNAVHAWVIDRAAVQHVLLPIDRAAQTRIVCWADQLGTRRSVRGVTPAMQQCPGEPLKSEEVFAQLVAPLQPHIRNTRLIIVPHGVLHYVPFAALRDPKNRHFLVEDYTITYAPSASVLRFLHGKESAVRGKALVIGDPDSSMGKLEGARREALAVAKLFGTTPKLGASATKSLLRNLNGEVDLVHIAAHGYYDAANPLFSRIALAPEGESNGNLEVHEVLSDVDLAGVNLVVLSACQTAMGKGSSGDDVVGLTRAFLYAGAPGVISTLWNVNDDAAVALMGTFYERLLAGDSAAEALRQSQMAMLRGRDYADPAMWAPFTLTGDPQGRWNAAAH